MGTLEDVFASMDFPAKLNNEALIIDDVTREISIPQSERIFGVENDEKAERKYFQAPRYVGDNIDLSKLTLRAVWRNAQGDESYDLADDLKIEGDNVTFSWLLRKKFTAYKGTVAFIICATKVQEDGTITNEWNTTLAYGEVLEGLEAYNPTIGENEKDIIAQLIKKVTDTSTKAVQDVTAEGQKQKEEIDNLSKLQLELIANKGEQIEKNRQNIEGIAIKNRVEGNPIIVKDSTDYTPVNLVIKGSTTQGENPSPEKPEEIVNSVFDRISCTGKNLCNIGLINYNDEDKNQPCCITDNVCINWEEYNFNTSESVWRFRFDFQNGESVYIMDNEKGKQVNVTNKNPIINICGRSTRMTSGSVYDIQVEYFEKPTLYELYKGFYDTLEQVTLSIYDAIVNVDGVWKKQNNTVTEVLNGTEPEWGAGTKESNFVYLARNLKGTKGYCTHYKQAEEGQIPQIGEFSTAVNKIAIYFYSEGSDLASFKNQLSLDPITVLRESLKPKYEVLSSETQQILNKIQTFYPNTILQTNDGIGLNLTYAQDTKTIVSGQQKQIDELRTLIEKYHPKEA